MTNSAKNYSANDVLTHRHKVDIQFSQDGLLKSFEFWEESGKRVVVAGSESKNTVSCGFGSDRCGGK